MIKWLIKEQVMKFKDNWLPYKLNKVYNCGMHEYHKMATVKQVLEMNDQKDEDGKYRISDLLDMTD